MSSQFLRWLGVAIVAAVALAAGIHFGGLTSGPGADPAMEKDAGALLRIALPDPSGKEVTLAQWKGKVLVVNFWATWCTPCREEMPEFVAAQRELGGRGLQFVGIAIDEPDKVGRFVDEIGLNYPALIGGYGAIELSKTLGNQVGALPFTIVIDRSGRIAHRQLGPLRDDKLRAIVAKLL